VSPSDAAATESSDPADQPFDGRTTIARRAMQRVAAAVAAETFGVNANDVRVDLTDADGLLAIAVRAPARLASLEHVRTDAAVIDRTGGDLVSRAAHGQTHIRRRVTELTGAEVAHVTVRLTSADLQDERRVR
jgi:uncharacterized alkaline shock family protein YloU